jgi:hypothetical protein
MKKRILIYLILPVLIFTLAGVTAYVQEKTRPQLGNRDELSQNVPLPSPVEQSYISDDRSHKIIINHQDSALYQELARRNAILAQIHYGSFIQVTVDEDALGGREVLRSMNLQVNDVEDLIPLNGYVLDASKSEPLSVELPADLRQTRMADSFKTGRAPAGGLFIVKFAGRIREDWLDTLKGTGAQIIGYVPSNAYIVKTDARSASRIKRMKEENPFVQLVDDYHGAYRIAPELRAARDRGDQSVKVIVQVIESQEGRNTIENLKQTAQEFFGVMRVKNFHNVTVTIPLTKLPELANNDSVFAIGPSKPIRRLDEAQGQILAGNLTGNSPSGPGYLAWLASKGFNSSQFNTFSVNLVDDSDRLIGHPDLTPDRVAFENNPTLQSGPQGGHGFINAHILGGFNDNTGTAFEDALGYNYGLGIAPWARIGVTAIFGPGDLNPYAWEDVAYTQGARISSNSWGFIDLFEYDSFAQAFDYIVRDAQDGVAGNQELTVVFAAGNDGPGSGTIGSPGTAKNVIAVGASENVRQTGTDGCGVSNSGADSANDIISFSSRGPVNSAGGDGRIKPDLVAPGTHIQGGVPQSNYDGSSACPGNQFFPAGQTLYSWSSGTSQATPGVAGGATLVYQDFLNKGLGAPSPAMVKAYLMNSATYITGTGAGGNLPSNSQGMGRMDLGRTFDGSPRILVDQTQLLGSTGQTYTATGSVASSAQPFRVTLAWTDAPGMSTSAPWVNNLDLEVTIGGQTYRGNVFSGANSIPGGAADFRNNSESVFLPAGVSGNFTVTVRATNIADDGVPGNADATDQDFALVLYNATTDVSNTPSIGVNPTSLSFTATAGGGNPGSQAFSITNVGTGTLFWTASDDATWITVNPASGIAPSITTASVDITGLAAGTYNGTITISAAGADNSPVLVPVTLTINPQTGGGGELVINGGFEGTAAPWLLDGDARIGVSRFPRSGTGNLLLGGVEDSYGMAYQQITIPAGSSPLLTFWINITTNENTDESAYDYFYAELYTPSGEFIRPIVTLTNLNGTSIGNYLLIGTSLADLAGQTVLIAFYSENDVSLPTTFRVDDVSVK